MLLLSSEAAFKTGGSLSRELTPDNLSQRLILCRPSLAYKRSGYIIFRTVFSVGIIGIYGITCHTSYPDIHEFLMHTDTVLQAYALIESLEREVFDE